MLNYGTRIRIKPTKECDFPDATLVSYNETMRMFVVQFDFPYYGMIFTLLSRNQFTTLSK